MGILSLIKSFRESSNNEAKLLILGLDNSGKTSILKALSDDDISNVTPTQGFNVKSLTQGGIKLSMWDIGGQKTIRQYWKHYFKCTDALIYVVDSSDKQRMEETSVELEQLLYEEQLQNVPLQIFANKQDLLNSLSIEEISQILELTSIRDRVWTIQPCSAKVGFGIREGMEWVISKVNNEN